MVFIPDALFSEELKSCPELWGLGKGYVSWKNNGSRLANILTKKTGTLITVEDVKRKWKNVRTYLKRLENTEGTRFTGMGAYVWYAHQLGLERTVARITKQILADGEVPVEVGCEEIKVKEEVQMDTDYEEFLRFDEMDNRLSQEKVTGEQTDLQTNERPFSIESPNIMDYSYNVNRYKNDIDDEKAITSNRITTQILAEGEVPVEVDFEEIKIKEEVQIDTDYEDFLRFDEMDNRFSQEKVTGEQTDVQRNERPSRIESPDVMGYSYNVNRYKNDKDDEKATTSAAAARGRKDRRFEPAVTPDESQEVEEAQRVVPDIEALRGVVRKLTPHDKIVQLHFNEVYTGLRSAYTRSEDKLYGRGYILNQELAETKEYRTVLVFGVRSILTAFNMLLSAYPIIRHKGNPELLEENLRIAEEIGLEVKAVVCDRSGQNRKAIRIFASGEFKRQRADGSKYIVVHMYDYIHILEAFRQKAITLNRRYDAAIVTKVAAQNTPVWGHWETRGASLLITSPRNLVETVQFFTPAMPAMLEIAIQRGIIGSAIEVRTYELFAAMTKFNKIFHSGKINSTNWQAQRAVLEEVREHLSSALEADLLAGETVQTMNRFIKLMDGLLEAYPGITIQSYRVSQDLLERFFCKVAPNKRNLTRPATQIMKLINRLIKLQIQFWGSGQSTTNDYHLIELMDYTMEDQAEEEFLPFGLDGVIFDDVVTGQVTRKEEGYIWLLTGYGIAQYIREHLRCQACLKDLTLRKEDANDPRDVVIAAHKYLEPEFAKPKVYDAFHNACDIYKFVILNHMVEANIGKRLQATIVARLAFFREASSCPDGRNHRTNLLGFIINLLLIGDNWVQETVTNVSSF
ncbi:uncharacterized protein ACN2A1_006398 isoform 1-T3 [Glossina fuscipes fuscipes]